MSHKRRRPERKPLSGNVIDFYDYVSDVPPPEARRQPIHKRWTPTIVTDIPDRVPVTEWELDLFEAHMGDVLDELFGQLR